ncbi:MAG: YHS domain-containing (seleno)protein [Thermoanaerobaculia bacterium]
MWIFSRLGAEPWGRLGSGVVELVASILILLPATVTIGALLAVGVMAGAVASHLTVLGIEVQGDGGLPSPSPAPYSPPPSWSSGCIGRRSPSSGGVSPEEEGKEHSMKSRTLQLALFALLAVPLAARAVEPVNQTTFGGVAIDGYDPVAYFEDGAAIEGSKEWTAEWNGATWRFASAEHRDLFVADPEAYAPRYGGYCAWAVSMG